VLSKFYAVSTDGELLTGMVNVDTAQPTCALRHRRAMGLAPDSTVTTVKGYALVSSGYDVTVLNTTAVGRKAPKDVMTEGLPELAAMFGHPMADEARAPPLVASNKQRLVVLAFTGGLVASYESDLPMWKPEFSNIKLWQQPVFVISVVMIAVWQFYRQKGMGSLGAGGGGGGGGRGLHSFTVQLNLSRVWHTKTPYIP